MRGAHRPARRLLVVTGGACALLLAAWATHPAWLPTLGSFLRVDEGPRPAEAVVPLAGELQRVAYAAELVRDGVARTLVVTPMALTGEAQRERHRRQVHGIARRRGVPPEAIVDVPRAATTTFDEVRTLQAFLEARGIGSVLVVTSPWHTRRSRMIVRDVFPGRSRVAVVPVPERFYQGARAEAWWRNGAGRRNVLSEYVKMIAYVVGVR